LTVIGPVGSGPVIPVSLATVQFSRSAERPEPGRSPAEAPSRKAGAPVGPGRAGPSKLNSMRRPRFADMCREAWRPPGSVDVLVAAVRAGSRSELREARPAACARGRSLERR